MSRRDRRNKKDDRDNAGEFGFNSDGSTSIGIGGGMDIDSDGDIGIKLGGGLRIDSSGEITFKF